MGMTHRARSAVAFMGIGLLIYAGLYLAAERLLVRNGHSNPLFKITTIATSDVDWLILGASHAMPLDFADSNARLQDATGLKIVNLASPGTGPLYNRFVLEAFLQAHRARHLLYVVDSFAFYSRLWNEDRFADAKLLRSTPFDPYALRLLLRYCQDDGVDPRAAADYLTGFSKINNRERFKPDIWEGELQFDRLYRPSAAAVRSRVAYLFPKPEEPTALRRYMDAFDGLLAIARQYDMTVTLIMMPVPGAFRAGIPDQATFDEALADLAARRGVKLVDFRAELDEPRFYFDTDHLNRTGVAEFFSRYLKPVLVAP
jgi:hypothetical protein